jgi:dolichol-phosphate mannosyltransferase
MKLSIVIPALNEKENIGSTIEEILKSLGPSGDITGREVIVVDDHSTDGTFDAVMRLGMPEVRCVRLSRRCGSHTALRAGIKEASGDAVLCISADGQDDPACIRQMVDKWKSGARVVWALRKSRANEPWYIRKPAQAFYRLLTWLGGVDRTDIDISRASFCLLDSAVAAAVNACAERNTSLFGLILWLGFDHDCVEYERRMRRSGTSRWRFKQYVGLAKDWLIGFSGLPLTLMSVAGVLVTLAGAVYALGLVIGSMSGNEVSGWSMVMTAVLLLGGIQMVMFGVMGEYIWRNLDESRRRPLFFIEKRSSTDTKKGNT